MSQSDNPKEILQANSVNLSALTEKLVTTGSLNFTSTEEVEFDLKNRDKDKKFEREQKWISFWVKDIGVFLAALLLVLLIDVYALTILVSETASEGKIRFAIAALTSSVTSLLSYLVGRSGK